MSMMTSRPEPRDKSLRSRIVIVGANFAGLIAAQHLGREYAVTVIDSSSWFEWLPNIHELLSGVKRSAILRLSRSRLVAKAGHGFVRATAAAIDVPAAKVITSDSRHFGFDLCMVAVGGVNDTFGVPGADRYAMPFKSVDQCHAIGRKLTMLARRPAGLSVVVCATVTELEFSGDSSVLWTLSSVYSVWL